MIEWLDLFKAFLLIASILSIITFFAILIPVIERKLNQEEKFKPDIKVISEMIRTDGNNR